MKGKIYQLLAVVVVALVVLAGCQPTGKKTAATYELPAVEDVVMYQVNPRVFAPQNSLKAVAQRIDSIAELGVNVMWVMPIYPIGKKRRRTHRILSATIQQWLLSSGLSTISRRLLTLVMLTV